MALAVKNIPAYDDDDAIARFAEAAPGWRIEYDSHGTLFVSPEFSDGGPREVEAAVQLRAHADRYGGVVFGSSSGFRLSDGSLRSPDAAWISAEHLERLSAAQRTKFWQTCPDVVIEILSATDDWNELVTKLDVYAASGAQYAVAIDPFDGRVAERGRRPEELELNIERIAGS